MYFTYHQYVLVRMNLQGDPITIVQPSLVKAIATIYGLVLTRCGLHLFGAIFFRNLTCIFSTHILV